MGSTEHVDPVCPDALIGANMAFSRSVLEKVPSFDVELGAGALGFEEDTLFSNQLSTAGYKIGVAADAVVEHHFDPDRATRLGFLDRNRKAGQSLAYTSYHWEHNVVAWPRLRLYKAQVRLMVARLFRRRRLSCPDGVPTWEADALSGVYFYRQYLKEHRRQFNYEKRGLVKLSRQ
jgi:GT2 family glycosyltransferase